MHQIVLLTALSATSGFFGGWRHGNTGYYYRYPTPVYQTYAAPAASCPNGACAARPQVYSSGYAAPAAPQAAAPVAPRTAAYPAYYYPATTCPGGNCSRR